MQKQCTGIWIIGARGGVAAAASLGVSQLSRRQIPPTGLVTELHDFKDLGLIDWSDLVIGGHEIRQCSIAQTADDLLKSIGNLNTTLVESSRAELDAIDARVRVGTLANCGEAISGIADSWTSDFVRESPAETIVRLQADISQFQSAENLEDVVVVNLASTEPLGDDSSLPDTWGELEQLLKAGGGETLPASSLYAIAALDLGMPYVNFTPSLGATPGAIDDLAQLRGTCHAGRDGKTGETLLKSALAPMFAARNLNVMSWVGHNIFGNMDAQVLDDPVNKSSKIESKDNVLAQIFGYDPQTLVTIEYIQSMNDWKTAWDHIHFQGFFGTPMMMQFTWQGCDSILAAPLVLDLVRLVAFAKKHKEKGALRYLASFFKSPLATVEHDFFKQFEMLKRWVANNKKD